MRFVLAISLILTAVPVRAGPIYGAEPESLIDRNTHEVDVDRLAKMYLISEQYKFNMSQFIPLKGLPENDDGDVIARRVFQHSLQTLLDNSEKQDSQVLSTASRVNNNMKSRVGSSRHAVVFRFKPIEARAQLTYEGQSSFKGAVRYKLDVNEFEAEITRDFGRKTLVVAHVSNAVESSDILGVRWSF